MRTPKQVMIEKIFEKAINVANRKVNLQEFKDTYFPDEDRVLWMNIKGMEHLNTGYTVKNGQLYVIDKMYDKPTITVIMDEDTFLAIALGEITPLGAFFLGELEAEGDEYMRDLHIFKKMMEQYRDVLKEIRGG